MTCRRGRDEHLLRREIDRTGNKNRKNKFVHFKHSVTQALLCKYVQVQKVTPFSRLPDFVLLHKTQLRTYFFSMSERGCNSIGLLLKISAQ